MPGGRRSVHDELALRAEIEARLGKQEKLYAIAKTLGCSLTTVRKYRDELLSQPATIARDLPTREQTQTTKATEKPTPSDFQPGQPVLYGKVQRTIDRLLPGNRLELRALPGGRAFVVNADDVTAL